MQEISTFRVVELSAETLLEGVINAMAGPPIKVKKQSCVTDAARGWPRRASFWNTVFNLPKKFLKHCAARTLFPFSSFCHYFFWVITILEKKILKELLNANLDTVFKNYIPFPSN